MIAHPPMGPELLPKRFRSPIFLILDRFYSWSLNGYQSVGSTGKAVTPLIIDVIQLIHKH